MKDSPHVLRARLHWVQLYEAFVCRRCGISRPTLRKWWARYQAEGDAGLRSRSPRPHTIKRKVTDKHVEWIRHLRLDRTLGPKRIHSELVRLHGFHLAASTIWTLSATDPGVVGQLRDRGLRRQWALLPMAAGAGIAEFTGHDAREERGQNAADARAARLLAHVPGTAEAVEETLEVASEGGWS